MVCHTQWNRRAARRIGCKWRFAVPWQGETIRESFFLHIGENRLRLPSVHQTGRHFAINGLEEKKALIERPEIRFAACSC